MLRFNFYTRRMHYFILKCNLFYIYSFGYIQTCERVEIIILSHSFAQTTRLTHLI